MDEWKSWFLLPLSFSSEAKETKYIHDILKATLSSALEEIKDKKLSANNFNSNYHRLELPFRMKTDKGYCEERYKTGNLTIIAGTGNTICVPSTYFINISNKTSQNLRISSQNFSIIVDGKAIKPLDEIVLRKEKRLLDSGDNRMNLQKTINIKPGKTGGLPVMYFEVPKSFREISYLQYIDKDIYKDPIFIKFKLQK